MAAFIPVTGFIPKTTSYRCSEFVTPRKALYGADRRNGLKHDNEGVNTIVAIKLPQIQLPDFKLPQLKVLVPDAVSNAFKNEPPQKPEDKQRKSNNESARTRSAAAQAQISVGGRKVQSIMSTPRGASSMTGNKGVKPGIPDDRKFYNPTSSRYYFRRGAMGQGYTSFDVRVGERGAKSENSRVNDQGTFRNMDLYTEPLVWSKQGWAPAEANVGVRAVYRNILGNAHLFEFDLEALKYSESCVRGNGNVKEFVRAVGLSDVYRKRFFTSCSQMRFVELNFKHFLGRAPRSQQEVSKHIQILANEGYNAEINSYIDSEEYDSLWGLTRVPDVNFRGGHNTNQEMNKLAVVNATPCASDSAEKVARFNVGGNEIKINAKKVKKGLPASWRGENAARTAAEPVMEYSIDKFWNTLPFGLKDDMRNWSARYGKWNKFYYKDSIVFKDMITPRLSVSDEEAAEAQACLKYGSLMADKYIGIRKQFDVAPIIEIKPPSNDDGSGGFVSLSMKEISTSIPSQLTQKV